MLTLHMKFQTAVIIFYFCHFSSSNRGPRRPEHKCETMGSLRRFCPCKDPLEKDSESYNYCSINIGTKLNLVHFCWSLRYVASNSFRREKKKYILVFHTMCVVPKRMTVLVHQWIHYPGETVVYFKPVGPMRKEARRRPWWTSGWTSSLGLQLPECVFMPGLCSSRNVSFSFQQIFIVCAS